MEQYDYYSDGVSFYRTGVRNRILVIDKTLTRNGFGGAQNTDWINIWQVSN